MQPVNLEFALETPAQTLVFVIQIVRVHEKLDSVNFTQCLTS